MAIDVQSKSYILLPFMEELIDYVFSEEEDKPEILVPRSWFKFDGWESENVVKITYNVGYDVNNKNFEDFYTYDLIQKKIVDLECEYE